MKQSYSPEAEKELRRTLLEFHEGRLVVGDKSKIRVTSLRQALAIGRARARRKEIETLSPKEWSTKPRVRD
jgi:hypothetical protein